MAELGHRSLVPPFLILGPSGNQLLGTVAIWQINRPCNTLTGKETPILKGLIKLLLFGLISFGPSDLTIRLNYCPICENVCSHSRMLFNSRNWASPLLTNRIPAYRSR